MPYWRIFNMANMSLTLYAKIKFSGKIPNLQYLIDQQKICCGSSTGLDKQKFSASNCYYILNHNF